MHDLIYASFSFLPTISWIARMTLLWLEQEISDIVDYYSNAGGFYLGIYIHLATHLVNILVKTGMLERSNG